MTLKHINSLSTFNTKKVACNAANTSYKIGGVGTIISGTPDIKYLDLVFIKNTNTIWTHDKFYSGSNVSVPLNSITLDTKYISGSYGVIDSAAVNTLSANRFAFLNPDGVTIEYSRDGGTTWHEYEGYLNNANDERKSALFDIYLTNSIYFVGGRNSDCDKNCLLRIIIDTAKAQCYTTLHKIIFNISTNYCSGCTVSFDRATHANPNTWINVATDLTLNGWSGYNVMNFNPITTYYYTDDLSLYLKFTFKVTGSSNGKALYIIGIAGYGGVGWATPSILAKSGHLYSYDMYKNATFPAKVTATLFIGPLDLTSTEASLRQLPTEAREGTESDQIILLNSNSNYIKVGLNNIWKYFKKLIKTAEITLASYTKSTSKETITSDSTINKAIAQLDYRTELLEWEEM